MRSTKERNSNFELLRIIAMLFIIFHHSVVHGLLNNNTSIGGWTPVATKVWLTTFTGQMVATLGKGCRWNFRNDFRLFLSKFFDQRQEVFQKDSDVDRSSLPLFNHHLLCCCSL